MNIIQWMIQYTSNLIVQDNCQVAYGEQTED